MSSTEETRIYIDRLRDGEEEKVSCILDPQFLDLQGDIDCFGATPVSVVGKVYIAGDFLIGLLNCSVEFTARCAVCSELFTLKIDLNPWRFEKPLDEIRGGIWDFKDVLREELLVKLPLFPQCGGNICLNRETVSHFFERSKKEEGEEEGFRPFQDLLE